MQKIGVDDILEVKDKLEFGGESPLTMRHGLQRLNEITSRPVASFRSRVKFDKAPHQSLPLMREVPRRDGGRDYPSVMLFA